MLVKEIQDVASRPKFIDRINQESIRLLFEIISTKCQTINPIIDCNIRVRDNKDKFLLAMSENINADYLITGDEDLLVLERYGNTHILKFTDFIPLI